MNRDEALKLLRGGADGVAEWNRRRETGEEIPSLEGEDLSGANLTNANLDNTNLSGADLYGASLHHARLCHADRMRSVK